MDWTTQEKTAAESLLMNRTKGMVTLQCEVTALREALVNLIPMAGCGCTVPDCPNHIAKQLLLRIPK
jgi:hypothetical protein